MPKKKTLGLEAIFAVADANGGDIDAAWQGGGQVTTLDNARRQYSRTALQGALQECSC